MDKKEAIKALRPIDDIFFSVLAKDLGVCGEILRTILEDQGLVVKEVMTQTSMRNLYGRSVVLDAMCVLNDGTVCNVEVQRANKDNHLRRVRYNAACITTNITNPGDHFEKVPTLYIVYISEFDVFGSGCTIYHVEPVITEISKIIDNGEHQIFVNTAVDDGTDIADLMRCFMQTEVRSHKFPRLSARVTEMKETEGGQKIMCDVMEQLIMDGRKEEKAQTLVNCVEGASKKWKATLPEACQAFGYTMEDYNEAKELLKQSALE